jgi:hypothetical protein
MAALLGKQVKHLCGKFHAPLQDIPHWQVPDFSVVFPRGK